MPSMGILSFPKCLTLPMGSAFSVDMPLYGVNILILGSDFSMLFSFSGRHFYLYQRSNSYQSPFSTHHFFGNKVIAPSWVTGREEIFQRLVSTYAAILDVKFDAFQVITTKDGSKYSTGSLINPCPAAIRYVGLD